MNNNSDGAQHENGNTTLKNVVVDDGCGDSNCEGRYAPGALVWVLLSKGKPKQTHMQQQQSSGFNQLALHKKRRDKKNKRKANNDAVKNDVINKEQNSVCGNVDDGSRKEDASEEDTNNKSTESECKGANVNTTQTTTLNQSRKEFFLRARVISDDEPMPSSAEENDDSKRQQQQKISERRILVRYSRGATYRVRAYNLIPILEPSSSSSLPPLVVLVPETNIYRRVARVHTTPDDTFMEIGCDYGITVDKIRQSLEDGGDVPIVWPPKEEDGGEVTGENEKKVVGCRVLGIDKSKESIDIANERFPKCKFALGNILIPEEMSSVRTLCEQSLMGSAPSVICIDVNGNREIDGVLECLSMVMNEKWEKSPRLIIVKSRFLYWELKEMMGDA